MLYVRNLTSDVTEEQLKEKFGEYGKVERVKKIKDYGFVHFEERADAIKAMEALNGSKIGNLEIDVSLAKPPSENKKKELRKREQERHMMRGHYYAYDDYWLPPARSGPPAVGVPLRRLPYPGTVLHMFFVTHV